MPEKFKYSAIRSIFRSIDRKKPYNILCAPINPRYIQSLAHTGHNFFVFRHKNNRIPFNREDSFKNIIYVDQDIDDYDKYFGVNFDLVLSEHKNFMQKLFQLSSIQQIPILHIENHVSQLSKYACHSYRGIACHHVFYSQQQANGYGFNGDENACHIIRRGLDTELFDNLELQRYPNTLLVVGNGIQQNPLKGFNWIANMRQQLPNTRIAIVGANANISPYVDTSAQMINIYNTHQIYFNTCSEPQPYAVIEAMACGCPVVSVPTMDNTLINENTALINNSIDGLIKNIVNLQNDVDKRNELAFNARKYVKDNFSLQPFVDKWNSLFDKVVV